MFIGGLLPFDNPDGPGALFRTLLSLDRLASVDEGGLGFPRSGGLDADQCANLSIEE
jgi:hypothetical protein